MIKHFIALSVKQLNDGKCNNWWKVKTVLWFNVTFNDKHPQRKQMVEGMTWRWTKWQLKVKDLTWRRQWPKEDEQEEEEEDERWDENEKETKEFWPKDEDQDQDDEEQEDCLKDVVIGFLRLKVWKCEKGLLPWNMDNNTFGNVIVIIVNDPNGGNGLSLHWPNNT